MKLISQKYFERLVKSADEVLVFPPDYVVLIEDGKVRKYPLSLWNEYEDKLTNKIIRNKEKNFFHYD